MGITRIKKGLDIPIAGEPRQEIDGEKQPKTVALLGGDYVGMKPTMAVSKGDSVKRGQLLFTDKKTPDVKYTAPGSGKVSAVIRGTKRVFLSIVIELDGDKAVTFESFAERKLSSLDRDTVVKQLIDSGVWPVLRARPFGKVADPTTTPHSIFITAMDTQPLAPSVEVVLQGREDAFKNGLAVLSNLTNGKLFLCKKPGTKIPTPSLDQLTVEEFSGPHPAGLPGTHIHFLDPVNRNKSVWHVDAQSVVDIGLLFTTGEFPTERVISLAGPSVKNPRLVKTRVGASIQDIVKDELMKGENRVISGSILSGSDASDPIAYLGRYHQNVSVLPEEQKRVFLGWTSFSPKLYSTFNVTMARLFSNKKFNFTTAIHGSERAIVPFGSYERVMPLDILPTPLLRAIAINDLDDAEQLGVLELVEEDLALCSFVCPSKLDHCAALRRNLNIIEKEG